MLRLLLPLLLLPLAALAQTAPGQTPPCGRDTACEIAGGSYHLLFPKDWDGQTALPTIVYYHGHRGSGTSIFRGGALQTTFADNGYLVIAPNGDTPPDADFRRWPARPTDGWRDDVAFTLAVLDNVATHAPIDPGRIYAAGFSAGGSMAWMVACYAGERFAGFASVAGALRRPAPPDTCPAGPVRLIQIHGFADKQVPFEGRGIGTWHQGDLFESFDLMRRTNACRSNPDTIDIGDRFRCRAWTTCGQGELKMCIHDGGHGLPRGWSDLAKAFFETVD